MSTLSCSRSQTHGSMEQTIRIIEVGFSKIVFHLDSSAMHEVFTSGLSLLLVQALFPTDVGDLVVATASMRYSRNASAIPEQRSCSTRYALHAQSNGSQSKGVIFACKLDAKGVFLHRCRGEPHCDVSSMILLACLSR